MIDIKHRSHMSEQLLAAEYITDFWNSVSTVAILWPGPQSLTRRGTARSVLEVGVLP